jgi:uncharacterized Zn finger protein
MRWRPYVPVADRRAHAAREAARLTKKGEPVAPVTIEGRKIATTYWGTAWCENLEKYRDFANRLPRGRTYVRNGSVYDLQIQPGAVRARVVGSDLYTIDVKIAQLQAARWSEVKNACTGKIGSLVSLLRGQLGDDVLQVLAHPQTGLFPAPREITMKCSCPDYAYLCKHIAATLYGIGARLDRQPELFFVLRQVDQNELLSVATEAPATGTGTGKKRIAAGKVAGVFGIELDEAPKPARPRAKK